MTEEQTLIFTASGVRLDVLISGDALSRSRAAALIEEGRVTVDGKVIVKPSFKAPEGAKVVAFLPEVRKTETMPEDIPLDILYEDEALAVINKPA